ncbi:MAG: anthranilate synthase component I family protein [Kiritimatiellia bacterium]|nr:chorismate-binding protein [Lentisphaerota bacterium]
MKTTLEDYCRLARNCNLIPVCRELLADTETPVSVLSRFADNENAFLLESVEGGETWGRYSFIGIDPVPLPSVDHAAGDRSFIERLRKVYRGVRAAAPPGLPRFFGGVVGFLAYEAVTAFERLPAPRPPQGSQRPCSRFLQADDLIVFDNLRHTMHLIVCSRPGNDPPAAYQAACGKLDQIEARLRQPAPSPAGAVHAPPEFIANMSQESYCAAVARAREYIEAGDVIQVVLSQRWQAHTTVPPLQMYRALRLLNPSPYMYFLKIGGQTLVGSSPEIMVRLTGSRLELRPIAGTRPRGGTEQDDRRLADDLLADEKEKAEHVMLVDLGRNDLGRVSETGSVQVRDYMTIERYSHVMHIVSHVESILRKDRDALDVLQAVFPAGTLSGAPKVRAMEIIHELEHEPRGAYGGALGYIGYDGSMDFAITIRTLEAVGDTVAVQAGAGIVYNSDPLKEWEETCQKAKGMRRAVEMAARGLTLDPEENAGGEDRQ